MVFEEAGKKKGLEVWRIEDFSAVAYPSTDHGKFYTGDSYIVLDTRGNGGQHSWSLHFWIGNQTSQDESASAAMLAVELDDLLGGVPVQYRETQGQESALFQSYFPKGLKYLPGGVKSGFKHFDPDQVEKRLFMVKGKRNIRVIQVDMTVTSLNKSDCFILDCGKGKTILVFLPPGARKMEKFRAIQVANEIRDEDHAGNAEVEVVDEYSGNINRFFEELGSGSMEQIPDGDQESDLQVKVDNDWWFTSVLRGKEFQFMLDHLTQTMLDNSDVYLLSRGGPELYVWIGRGSSKEEKVEAMKAAEEFIKAQNLSKGVRLVRILEGLETAIFKQLFQAWNELDDDIPAPPPDAEQLNTSSRSRILRAGGTAQGFMPDDGTGPREIWRIENMELTPVPSTTEFLFGGDSYVILYTSASGPIIYNWQGITSSLDERAAAAIHSVNMDDDLRGKAVQIRVAQGEEPRHFLKMFGGKLVVFAGGKASGFKNVNDRDEYEELGSRLFRIRCLSADGSDARAEQVIEATSSLASDDVFILESRRNCWIWRGKASGEEEVNVARRFAAILCPDRQFQEINEDEEGQDFWTELLIVEDPQGKMEKADQDQRPPGHVALYHLTQLANGDSKAEEIAQFSKKDLVEEDIMLLDTGREIILWIGELASGEERKSALKMGEAFLTSDPSYRTPDNTVIMECKQGTEPLLFTSFFADWLDWLL